MVSIAWDLFFSKSISVADPPHWLNELLLWILLVVYLTAGWWSTGRTVGKQMTGLQSSVRMGLLFGSYERFFERSSALPSSQCFCWPW